MRQELAHKSAGSLVFCLESEVAVLDLEFPFLCGFGAGVFVALALAVILRTCALIVMNQKYVRTYESNVAQPRISDRRVLSR